MTIASSLSFHKLCFCKFPTFFEFQTCQNEIYENEAYEEGHFYKPEMCEN